MSGRKSNRLNFQNIVSGDMSATSITSTVSNIEFMDNVGIQLHFTGTPTGTFDVQVSADHAQDSLGNVTVAGNWVSVTLSPSPAATGAAGDIYIDMNQLSAPWIRVVYTKTSGTGTLQGYIVAKQV